MTAAARPAYRFSENAVGNTANEYGNYILKRGAGEIRKPSWNRTESVVRFLPQWNFETNQWEPYRCSPAPMDFGDWIRRYDAVRGFGESGITFLLYDPVANPAYDIQSNPCVILYRAINGAIDAKQCEPDWPALLKGGNNRRAALGRHVPIYIARCGIFRIKSKDMATADRSPLGLANSDPPFFLELPKTAGEKLIALLEDRNEDFKGDPEDYQAAYKHGDVVSLNAGAYVHMFEEGADPRANSGYQAGAAPRQLTVGSGGRGNYGGGSGGGGNSQFKGYDLYIEPTWNGFSAQLNTPELERLIKSKQRPWEDCLQFLEHQEQAFLVQDGFPPGAIMYAWRDHPEWIKDETRSKAVGRVSRMAEALPPAEPFRGAGQPLIRVPTRAETVSPKVEQISGGDPRGAESGAATPTTPAQEGAPVGSVGGWGTSSAADPTATESKDSVVPQSLPTAEGITTVDTNGPSREQKALAALEAARARAGRS